MKFLNKQKNRGFTLVEALVAIFILSISVSSMLGVTASTASSARYANNEIAANYLLQEAVDSVRNSRDTLAFQMLGAGGNWNTFLNRYGYSGNSKCFSPSGCMLVIENFNGADLAGSDVVGCTGVCAPLYYDDNAVKLFYNYNSSGEVVSKFTRTVNMVSTPGNPDEIKITATVNWTNGSSPKTQSLEIYLLNWQK
jgi:prepilin-type N-terminal cleavage/methylation domain-containing protein